MPLLMPHAADFGRMDQDEAEWRTLFDLRKPNKAG
jgi:hypothetical protein